MKIFVRTILCICLWIVAACPLVEASEMAVSDEMFDFQRPAVVKIDDKGHLWAAYYDLAGGIHLTNLSEHKDLLVNEGSEPYSGGLALAVENGDIFVAWRVKQAGIKKLYFRAFYDGGASSGAPMVIDDNTEALKRIEIGANRRGDVMVVWYGERKTATASYSIHVATSNDRGKSFSKPFNLTEGYSRSIYPTLLMDEENAYTFSYSRKGQNIYMIFRKTTDGGRTWSPAFEIKEIGTVTLFIKPIQVHNRLHVFWFNTYDSPTEGLYSIIEAAYSDDGGTTWTTASLEETRGLDVSMMNISHDAAGHIYMALSGRWDSKEKDRVYLMRSEDNGATWEKVSIRHYPYDHTIATSPDVLAGDDGEVVVAWVDYRNIRSNLYMQFSRDYGRSWQEQDVPIGTPGKFNMRHWPYSESIVRKNGTYHFLAHRFESDNVTQDARLLLMGFSLDRGGAE